MLISICNLKFAKIYLFSSCLIQKFIGVITKIIHVLFEKFTIKISQIYIGTFSVEIFLYIFIHVHLKILKFCKNQCNLRYINL